MNSGFTPVDPLRFQAALRRFDEENAHDPNTVSVDGQPRPKELQYSLWLSDWVLRLCPEASEALRLAARSQHICRWLVPRDSYPKTRAGYLQWRKGLKKFHAQKAGEILRELDYPDEIIARVQHLNLKKNLGSDPETQILEDALCLVFLERQLDDLAAKTNEEQLINALQKSWKKMSGKAQAMALGLHYGPHQPLIERALGKTGMDSQPDAPKNP